MEKTCSNCGQTLPEDEFYKDKNICIYCYRRQARLRKRVESGRPVKTVADLMAELIGLPRNTKVMVCDDISLYRPTSVEFVRNVFKGHEEFDNEEYDNTIVIV